MTGTLSFASLLFTSAQGAQAMDPIAEVVAAAAEPSAAAPLTGRWSHEIKGRELVVRLTLANTGSDPVEVLIARGKMPGTDLQANIDGVALQRVFSDEEMSGQMSRMGPMPRFAPVAGKKEILAGTYRFTLPDDYRGDAVRLEASVRTDADNVTLATVVNAPLGV